MGKGFTLVEMVVVLVLMAALAHLAVAEFGRLRESRLSDAADRQLAELRDAVWSLGEGGEPRGFLADMGRLPRRLDELWAQPPDARRFAVTNVTGAIHVPTGWRGPYLRLPVGKDALFDPWGNDFGMVTNDAGFVTAVFHNGADGNARTRSREVSLVPPGGAAAALTVVPDEDGETAATAVNWYGPDGSGGVTNGAAAVLSGNPVRFEGLTPGERVLSCGGSMRLVRLLPGDNICRLRGAR